MMKWRKMPAGEYGKVKTFLMEREKYCVAACARFLRINENRGHVWYLDQYCRGASGGPENELNAILLHSRHTLFPVFDEDIKIPGPRFLNRFLGKVKIHAIQGLLQAAEPLEVLMENQGYFAAERIDYHLMSLDAGLSPGAAPLRVLKSGPSGLVLRKPAPEDEESLFALQAAYEQEEVLPVNSAFDPVSCRLNLKRIISSEQIILAEFDGQVVGKINTSAKSFTRYQIGGVYVRPDCRGLGIGIKMTSFFCESLLAQGKGLTLFVKKRNAAAAKVYRKAGFSVSADYRISYY